MNVKTLNSFASAFAAGVGCPVLPADYKSAHPRPPYAKFSLIDNDDRASYGSTRAVEGVMKLLIMTVAGEGPAVAATLRTQLDAALEDRQLGDVVTGLSSLQSIGRDPSDATLWLSEYSLPYTYYGE